MKVLIVANSSIKDIKFERSNFYDCIIVLDGAGNYVDFDFDYLIGDLDSLEEDKKLSYRKKIIHKPQQSNTDLQKGIVHADELGATHIDIINALGGRLDHAIINVRTLKMMYSKRRRLRILDSEQLLEFYQDCDIRLQGKVGGHIGVMAAPSAVVTSNGLKYDMENTMLEWGIRESSSNSFVQETVFIKTKGGILVNMYV